MEEGLEILNSSSKQEQIIGICQDVVEQVSCARIPRSTLPLNFLKDKINGQDKDDPTERITLPDPGSGHTRGGKALRGFVFRLGLPINILNNFNKVLSRTGLTEGFKNGPEGEGPKCVSNVEGGKEQISLLGPRFPYNIIKDIIVLKHLIVWNENFLTRRQDVIIF